MLRRASPSLAVDMPGANDLTVDILALVAEAGREAIPPREEALAAAKARGGLLPARIPGTGDPIHAKPMMRKETPRRAE